MRRGERGAGPPSAVPPGPGGGRTGRNGTPGRHLPGAAAEGRAPPAPFTGTAGPGEGGAPRPVPASQCQSVHGARFPVLRCPVLQPRSPFSIPVLGYPSPAFPFSVRRSFRSPFRCPVPHSPFSRSPSRCPLPRSPPIPRSRHRAGRARSSAAAAGGALSAWHRARHRARHRRTGLPPAGGGPGVSALPPRRPRGPGRPAGRRAGPSRRLAGTGRRAAAALLTATWCLRPGTAVGCYGDRPGQPGAARSATGNLARFPRRQDPRPPPYSRLSAHSRLAQTPERKPGTAPAGIEEPWWPAADRLSTARAGRETPRRGPDRRHRRRASAAPVRQRGGQPAGSYPCARGRR